MWKKIKLFIILCFCFVPSIEATSTSTSSYAQDSTYIDKLTIDIKADAKYCFHIQQKIIANLNNKHGIYVNLAYQPGINKIENIEVEGPGTYDLSTDENVGASKGVLTVKVGDEDKTYKGKKTWTLRYDLQGFKKTANAKNQLTLALAPAYWELPIKTLKTKVQLPKSVDWTTMKIISGNPDTSSRPVALQKSMLTLPYFHLSTTKKQLTLVGENLPAKYGASIQGPLPTHYWDRPPLLSNYAQLLLSVNVVLLCLALFCWLIWGRDKKPVETIEFYPPDQMDPAQMGYFIDGYVDNKDIVAMFFYFADQGMLRIEEVQKKLSREKQFRLIKQNKEPTVTHQKLLLNGMFSQGNVFASNQTNEKFTFCLGVVKAKIAQSLPNIYTKTSLKVKQILLWAGIIIEMGVLGFLSSEVGAEINGLFLILLGALAYMVCQTSRYLHRKHSIEGMSSFKNKAKFIFALLTYLGLFWWLAQQAFANPFLVFLSGALFIIFLIIVQLIKKRNENYLMLDGKILGFKRFIETAELNQLNILVEENPDYFYHVLPYAYIFGLTDKWAKHFEQLSASQPTWYSGDRLAYRDWSLLFYSMTASTIENQSKDWMLDNDHSSNNSNNYSSGSGFGSSGGGAW